MTIVGTDCCLSERQLQSDLWLQSTSQRPARAIYKQTLTDHLAGVETACGRCDGRGGLRTDGSGVSDGTAWHNDGANVSLRVPNQLCQCQGGLHRLPNRLQPWLRPLGIRNMTVGGLRIGRTESDITCSQITVPMIFRSSRYPGLLNRCIAAAIAQGSAATVRLSQNRLGEWGCGGNG
jgi:hypothetical protein